MREELARALHHLLGDLDRERTAGTRVAIEVAVRHVELRVPVLVAGLVAVRGHLVVDLDADPAAECRQLWQRERQGGLDRLDARRSADEDRQLRARRPLTAVGDALPVL